MSTRWCQSLAIFGLVLTFACALSYSANSQSKASVKATKENAQTAPKSSPSDVATRSPTSSKGTLAGAVSDAVLQEVPSPGADYIPCRFTYAELKTLVAPEEVLTLSPADAEALIEKVTSTIQQQQSAGSITAILQEELFKILTYKNIIGLTPSQALQSIINSIQEARKSAAPREKEEAQAEVQKKKQRPDIGNTDTKSSQLSEDTSTAIAPIVSSARDAIQRLSRPIDVGCAMSVLSYDETTKAFGYIIAKNYIAIQVVVRNLNRDQQFVLHDVEYAVNTDPEGRSGRFYSGRDKIVVRALASAESSFDPRNVVVHGAQGVGALLSTLVPIYGLSVGAAAAVYNGGFFPSLDKVWKDMSTDQLNLLNDTGFSSSSSSQTVVPKSGTVMFVTFIPEKQFEQGWWTQNCASDVALGILSSNENKAIIPLTGVARAEAAAHSRAETAAPSIDLDRAARACAYSALQRNNDKTPVKEKSVRKSTGLLLPDSVLATGGATTGEKGTVYAVVGNRPFKKWSGNSLAIFEELSSTVVAGMHIVDEKDLELVLSQISCNPDPKTGIVQFTMPDTGSLACQLKGKNLDKVKLIRLRNTDDPSFAEGQITIANGDNTKATATFTTSSLHNLARADYTVEAVSKTGVETATTQALHFDPSPFIAELDPAIIDVAKLTSGAVLTLKGYHLDKIKGVLLQTDSGKVSLPIAPAPIQSDKQVALTLDSTELVKLGKAAVNVKWFVLLKDSDAQVAVVLPLAFKPAATVSASSVVAKPKPPAASQSTQKSVPTKKKGK